MDKELKDTLVTTAKNYNSICKWSKITLVISGIATVGFLVYAFWDGICSKFEELKDFISSKF